MAFSGPDLRPSPRHLIRACGWLESPALEKLVENVGRRYELAPGDLPDLVQETRIALWKMGMDEPVRPALVRRIAANKAVDLIRARARRRYREKSAFPHPDRGNDGELNRLLHVQISRLPLRLRQFYELHYHQGRSEREICRRWGICRASVRWMDRQLLRLMTRDRPATDGSGPKDS